ncbi:hypothetical protein B0H67DRAFT_474824 [Lasiosphaeris hirsuta]|uniref:Threonine/serine exporter-like N-terminal domain-containing protein n=1 Tax=Lasiosphaeris hirsuta TaxID=260670 RepID=A0AA40B9K4_9PEZI|nr:hypothetical protein B0H67DRAFT_474824 [Lasiosphaeris hirsuta]
MDSQRAPEGPFRTSPSNGVEQQIPQQNVGNPLSRRAREKKKVGFASDNESQDPTNPFLVTPEPQQFSQDYFSFSPGGDTNASSTPMATEGGPAKRDSFNKDELTAALAEILQPEHHGGTAPPSLPRPVLRRPMNADSPPSDISNAVPHWSEVEAKNRADRLAFAVGSSLAPASRRGSLDGVESGMSTPFDREALLSEPEGVGTNSHDVSSAQNSSGLRVRKGAQQAATDLVRRHARRATPLMHQLAFPRSGTATPVSDDLENIPHPEKYKGGILGNLLKLYNADDKNRSEATFSSAPSTPGRTPNRSPSNTPPTSRPSTPRLGGRGFRGSRPPSGTALEGLVSTSLMFTAPGSEDISKAASDKIKQERERPRKRTRSKKQEEFRITVHIAQIISRHQYLIKLCKSLMMYGAPTHRLEAYMKMSARVLGIEGQFMYLPGAMIISFDDSNTHTTEVKILRTPQGVDLGRLRDVHQIYKEVVHDILGAEEAINRLNEVADRSDKFPIWLRIFLFGIASATVAPFGFEGRYIDMPICFILGCLVGFLQLFIAPSNELYANVFEIMAAVATSFLSRVFGSININGGGHLFCFSAMAQSSIALILPGYIVLCASLELQSHQMISGSVRMVYALIYSLFLGYGITIGSVIYGYIDPNAVSAVHCSAGEEWYSKRPGQNYYLLFVLPFTLCLCCINQAKWKQTPVMVVISLAGYCVNNFSSRHFRGNATLSNSLGALCIGVLANLYSRLGRKTQNLTLDLWEKHLSPRMRRLSPWYKPRHIYYNSASNYSFSTESVPKDVEPGLPPPPSEKAGEGSGIARHTRRIGYGLAAAAMLPAIFVQVPSGLAVGGSLLSGVTSADQITRNETMLVNGTMAETPRAASSSDGDLNSTAFNVLFSVIQVAISISVGLSLSALIVYPFGKRRSGLFSF